MEIRTVSRPTGDGVKHEIEHNYNKKGTIEQPVTLYQYTLRNGKYELLSFFV